jgi:hypothetical protein
VATILDYHETAAARALQRLEIHWEPGERNRHAGLAPRNEASRHRSIQIKVPGVRINIDE